MVADRWPPELYCEERARLTREYQEAALRIWELGVEKACHCQACTIVTTGEQLTGRTPIYRRRLLLACPTSSRKSINLRLIPFSWANQRRQNAIAALWIPNCT